MAFRYFDSKRPLVVSFRRTNNVNKMSQGSFTLEHCRSVNDFERTDKYHGCGIKSSKRNISSDRISLKALSKQYENCGANNGGNNLYVESNNCYGNSVSCRNFP